MRPGLSPKAVRNRKNIESEIRFYLTRINSVESKIKGLQNQLQMWNDLIQEDKAELENLQEELM